MTTMSFRNLDENGDWTWGQGTRNYLTKQDAIELNIDTRLESWVGDCFFDQNAGIDYTNRMGSKNQQVLLSADFQRLINSSFGVTGISSFSASLVNRQYSANFSADSIYSQSYVSSITRETSYAG